MLNRDDNNKMKELIHSMVDQLFVKLPDDDKLIFVSRFLGLVEEYIYDEYER